MNRYNLLTLLLLFFILGSFSKQDQAELKEAMKNASYSSRIFNKLAVYQTMGEILKANIDTLILHAKSKDLVLRLPDHEYSYNSSVQNTNIKDLPKFIYTRIDSLWKQVGEGNMISLDLDNDKTITLNIFLDKKQHNITEAHQLIWNIKKFDNNHSFDLFKDTVLKGYIYRIGLFQGY